MASTPCAINLGASRPDHRHDARPDRFWQVGPSVDYRLQVLRKFSSSWPTRATRHQPDLHPAPAQAPGGRGEQWTPSRTQRHVIQVGRASDYDSFEASQAARLRRQTALSASERAHRVVPEPATTCYTAIGDAVERRTNMTVPEENVPGPLTAENPSGVSAATASRAVAVLPGL